MTSKKTENQGVGSHPDPSPTLSRASRSGAGRFVPAEPAAWLLRVKKSGFIRGFSAEAPSANAMEFAEIEGEEYVPMCVADEVRRLQAMLNLVAAERDRLHAEVERQRALIGEVEAYADHSSGCAANQTTRPCDCGYEALLAKLKAHTDAH
jgi:hypothetical protein